MILLVWTMGLKGTKRQCRIQDKCEAILQSHMSASTCQLINPDHTERIFE